MKNLNWILHAISLIAIIFLFVQNRNCKSHCKTDSSAQNTSLISNSGTAAFFNSDSLLGQLKFFKDNEIMFKKKQESMMKELQAKEENMQREFQKLQKNAENMTRNETENAQKKLAGMERDLMERKEKLSNQFAEETAEFNEALHKKVISFLQEYNADNRYKFIFSVARDGNIFYSDPSLDITAEMVKALNEKYSQ
ncbi:MAG: OmpH family outer membrane protein [Saprospiraceae bacterium]|nr:OmpH family outer membrane protein [Saprospiraceae bacterium]MBK8448649.1 OmpH family outer membrane protein [Saprospiraceae bacterium]MBK8482847.1 OmpH family outer membrane protein [Saprospiraceae bacterium]MBK9722790.1 OmpH family outer membrane protein [Saprospiraceae bacterium]